MDVLGQLTSYDWRNESREECETSRSYVDQIISTSQFFSSSHPYALIKQLRNLINGLISRLEETQTQYEEVNAINIRDSVGRKRMEGI